MPDVITIRLRRRTAALALSLSAVLAAPAADAATASGAGAAPGADRAAAPATHAAARAAASCPTTNGPLHSAADKSVQVDRITPKPVYRDNCKQLYRADGRGPDVIFGEGFRPKDTKNGQYDLQQYVARNQPSPYVSTSYDHDLYQKWKARWNYYIDAPGGIDVNKTIGSDHKYASQEEVAFPGGVDEKFIVGACPVNKETKREIMNDCVDNPHYQEERA